MDQAGQGLTNYETHVFRDHLLSTQIIFLFLLKNEQAAINTSEKFKKKKKSSLSILPHQWNNTYDMHSSFDSMTK